MPDEVLRPANWKTFLHSFFCGKNSFHIWLALRRLRSITHCYKSIAVFCWSYKMWHGFFPSWVWNLHLANQGCFPHQKKNLFHVVVRFFNSVLLYLKLINCCWSLLNCRLFALIFCTVFAIDLVYSSPVTRGCPAQPRPHPTDPRPEENARCIQTVDRWLDTPKWLAPFLHNPTTSPSSTPSPSLPPLLSPGRVLICEYGLLWKKGAWARWKDRD